jgi:hypothetical protein
MMLISSVYVSAPTNNPFHWVLNNQLCAVFSSTLFLWPTKHINSEMCNSGHIPCKFLPSYVCNFDVNWWTLQCILQCSALTAALSQCMHVTQSLLFVNYKNYTSTLVLGQWWGKYPLSHCGKTFVMTAKNTFPSLWPVLSPSPLVPSYRKV